MKVPCYCGKLEHDLLDAPFVRDGIPLCKQACVNFYNARQELARALINAGDAIMVGNNGR